MNEEAMAQVGPQRHRKKKSKLYVSLCGKSVREDRSKGDALVGVFTKLRRATVSFVMTVLLPVRLEQLGSHWTDFHEIKYLITFRKICRENSSFV